MARFASIVTLNLNHYPEAFVDKEEGCLVVPNRLPTDSPPFTKQQLQVCVIVVRCCRVFKGKCLHASYDMRHGKSRCAGRYPGPLLPALDAHVICLHRV